MKRLVLGGLLLIVASMATAADGISLGAGRAMIGRVVVGPNIGSICSVGVTTIRQDLFSPRYEVVFRIVKFDGKKWVTLRGESFSVQNYSNGDLFGAKQIVAKNGVVKKITTSLFLDQPTQTYKMILNEASLVPDGSTSKYIVCENMVPR